MKRAWLLGLAWLLVTGQVFGSGLPATNTPAFAACMKNLAKAVAESDSIDGGKSHQENVRVATKVCSHGAAGKETPASIRQLHVACESHGFSSSVCNDMVNADLRGVPYEGDERLPPPPSDPQVLDCVKRHYKPDTAGWTAADMFQIEVKVCSETVREHAGGLPVFDSEAPAASTSATPTAAPTSELDSIGCVGRNLDVCLAYVSHAMNLDRDTNTGPMGLEDQRQRNKRTDVNGKLLSVAPSIFLSGKLHGIETSDEQNITIDYGANDIVTKVSLSLPSDPEVARSEEDYAKTGLYEGVTLLFGSDCPSLDRLTVYRFFENSVKPKVNHDGRKIEVGMTNATESYSGHSEGIPFCGRTFEYGYDFGTDTNDISETNEHGTSSIYLIYVSGGRANTAVGTIRPTTQSRAQQATPAMMQTPTTRAADFGANLSNVWSFNENLDAKMLNIPGLKAASVDHIVSGSIADRAGLKYNDMIYQFGGKSFKDADELRMMIQSTPVGQKVDIGVIRTLAFRKPAILVLPAQF